LFLIIFLLLFYLISKDRLNHIGPEEFILYFMSIEGKSQNETLRLTAGDENTKEIVKFGSKRFSQLLGVVFLTLLSYL
jgi:hypothetical protein